LVGEPVYHRARVDVGGFRATRRGGQHSGSESDQPGLRLVCVVDPVDDEITRWPAVSVFDRRSLRGPNVPELEPRLRSSGPNRHDQTGGQTSSQRSHAVTGRRFESPALAHLFNTNLIVADGRGDLDPHTARAGLGLPSDLAVLLPAWCRMRRRRFDLYSHNGI